jgi:hypothetical protein
MAIMCSDKKCSPISIFFFVMAVAVILLIWLGAGSLMGKSEVENGLKQISAQLADVGDKHGKNVKLSYGDISIEGWGSGKKAVVHNVSVDMSDKVAGDISKVSASVDDIVVSSDPVNLHKLLVQISKPITLSQNSQVIKSFSFSEPLKYYYLQIKDGNAQSFQHEVVFPQQISVSGRDAKDAAVAGEVKIDDEEISVSFAENPFLKVIDTPEQKTNSFSYGISGLRIFQKDQNIITIGELKSSLDEELGDVEGRIVGKYILSASDIAFYSGENSTKPYSVSVNTDITSDAIEGDKKVAPQIDSGSVDVSVNQPAKVEELGSSRNREVVINNVILSNPDFKMQATGKFSNIKGDPLPSGEINVDIDNLAQFLDSEIVAMQNRKMVETALEKMLGEPLSGKEQVSILLKRDKGGVFYVGQTTFEGLVASVLSGSIIPSMPSGDGRFPEIERAPKRKSSEQNMSFPDMSVPSGDSGSVELPVEAPKP